MIYYSLNLIFIGVRELQKGILVTFVGTQIVSPEIFVIPATDTIKMIGTEIQDMSGV